MTLPPAGGPVFPRPESDERRDLRRFSPRGWVAKVTLPRTFLGFGGGQALNAPLLDVSEAGARLIMPMEIAKGAQIRVRIEDPKFKDVVEWAAQVIWATPPPPVATTWIIGVEFVDLPRDLQLKISGWLSYYGSEQFRMSQERSTVVGETRARPDPMRETRSRRAAGRDTKSRKRETARRRAVRPDDKR